MTGNNPITGRIELGSKRHILTDKNGIPLSTIITPASTHDVKLVTDVIDNAVIKRRPATSYLQQEKEVESCISIYALIEYTVLNR